MANRHKVLIIDPQFATDPDVERTVLHEDRYDIDIWRPLGDEPVPAGYLAWADAVLNCRSRCHFALPCLLSSPRRRVFGNKYADLA